MLPDAAATDALVGGLYEHRDTERFERPLDSARNFRREPFLDLQAIGIRLYDPGKL